MSLFDSVDDRLRIEARRREAMELSRMLPALSKYPAAPALIRRAWAALVPTIMELSHHQTHDRLNLLQSVRKSRDLQGAGSRRLSEEFFEHRGETLNGWVLQLLVLLGTLPIDAADADGYTGHNLDAVGIDGASIAQGVESQEDPVNLAETQVSCQSRSEAMICLEMLCHKVWHCRHVQRMNQADIETALYAALEYLYWECAIPARLTMMWDAPPELSDSVYNDVRRYNYRQLYAIEAKGQLNELFNGVYAGMSALEERRHHFQTRFDLSLRRDPRWKRSFTAHCEIIKSKYAVLTRD